MLKKRVALSMELLQIIVISNDFEQFMQFAVAQGLEVEERRVIICVFCDLAQQFVRLFQFLDAWWCIALDQVALELAPEEQRNFNSARAV